MTTKVVSTSVKLSAHKTTLLDLHTSCWPWTTEPSSQTKRSVFLSLTTIQNHGTQLGLLLISSWVASPSGWATKKPLDLFTLTREMTNPSTDKRQLGNQETLFSPTRSSKSASGSTSHSLELRKLRRSRTGLHLLKRRHRKKRKLLKLRPRLKLKLLLPLLRQKLRPRPKLKPKPRLKRKLRNKLLT